MSGLFWVSMGVLFLVFVWWGRRRRGPDYVEKVINKRNILVSKRMSFYPLSKRGTWIRDDQNQNFWDIDCDIWIPYDDILHVELSQDKGEVVKTYGYQDSNRLPAEETVGEWKDTVKYVEFIITIRNNEEEWDDGYVAVLVDFPEPIDRNDEVGRQVIGEAEEWYGWFKTIIEQNQPPLPGSDRRPLRL